MDILTILKAEHERIRADFIKLAATEGTKARKAVLDELAQDLQVYLTLEKDYLYPEFAGLFSGATALMDVGQANGAGVSRRLKTLLKLGSKPLAEQEGYDKREEELKESVLQYFDFEEQQLMPKVRGSVRTEEREDIGQLFLDVKEEVRRGLEVPQAKAVAVAPAGRKRA